MTGQLPLSLQQAAALVGGHCWSERQVFELLGSWVPQVPEVDVKVVLDRHSAHGAWRSQQWQDRLPVLAGVSRLALVAPTDAALAQWYDAVGESAGTVGRLAAIYRVVLPRLVGSYRRHLAVTSELADGPTRRTLTMALTDVVADWVDGELLLQRHLVDVAAVVTAADRVAALESLVSRD